VTLAAQQLPFPSTAVTSTPQQELKRSTFAQQLPVMSATWVSEAQQTLNPFGVITVFSPIRQQDPDESTAVTLAAQQKPSTFV
jgi:hypothetical protein